MPRLRWIAMLAIVFLSCSVRADLMSDADLIMNEQERLHPDLFPSGPMSESVQYLGDDYYVRGYENNNFLGIKLSDSSVYVLGPNFTQGTPFQGIPQKIATVEQFLRQRDDQWGFTFNEMETDAPALNFQTEDPELNEPDWSGLVTIFKVNKKYRINGLVPNGVLQWAKESNINPSNLVVILQKKKYTCPEDENAECTFSWVNLKYLLLGSLGQLIATDTNVLNADESLFESEDDLREFRAIVSKDWVNPVFSSKTMVGLGQFEWTIHFINDSGKDWALYFPLSVTVDGDINENGTVAPDSAKGEATVASTNHIPSDEPASLPEDFHPDQYSEETLAALKNSLRVVVPDGESFDLTSINGGPMDALHWKATFANESDCVGECALYNIRWNHSFGGSKLDTPTCSEQPPNVEIGDTIYVRMMNRLVSADADYHIWGGKNELCTAGHFNESYKTWKEEQTRLNRWLVMGTEIVVTEVITLGFINYAAPALIASITRFSNWIKRSIGSAREARIAAKLAEETRLIEQFLAAVRAENEVAFNLFRSAYSTGIDLTLATNRSYLLVRARTFNQLKVARVIL